MIRVIDGKRYDTEKANFIFKWFNGHMQSDFHYRKKVLYQTQSGVWFIHHVGGARSDMAVSFGNSSGGSENIEPVSADDAYGFLEAHSDDEDAVAAIDKYFADRVVDA